MAKEVKIELTEAQKAKIKAATGKTMSELKVTSVGKNVAVSSETSEKSARVSEQGLREEGMRSIEEQGMRGVEIAEQGLRPPFAPVDAPVDRIGELAAAVNVQVMQKGLRGAEIGEAGLRGAEIGEAGLRGAEIEEAGLRGAEIEESGLRGAEIEESGLREEGLREEGLREEGLREEGLREEGLREEGLREEGLRDEDF